MCTEPYEYEMILRIGFVLFSETGVRSAAASIMEPTHCWYSEKRQLPYGHQAIRALIVFVETCERFTLKFIREKSFYSFIHTHFSYNEDNIYAPISTKVNQSSE